MRTSHWFEIEAEVAVPNQKAKAAVVRRILREGLRCEGLSLLCEIHILFTDDAGIREINNAQRGIDAPTDVLSFPMFDLQPGEHPDEEDCDPGTGLLPLGDIVISIERMRAQAKEYGHSETRELGYLVVHSLLHLLGYDHVDEAEGKARMRAREEAILVEVARQQDGRRREDSAWQR